MDDKFLFKLRELPDEKYVRDLERKLSQIRSAEATNFYQFVRSSFIVKAVVLLLIALITISAITPVRAFVSSFISRVAGLSFEVTEDYPGDNDPGGTMIIQPSIMTLDEALAAYPHSINLPSSVPSGYTLNEDEVRVYTGEEAGPFRNTIEFQWVSESHEAFNLKVTDHDPSLSEVVAPDSIEEIQLREDYPAVLIHGGWDADQKEWRNDIWLRLRWSIGNLNYELMGTDLEMLLQIAASTLK